MRHRPPRAPDIPGLAGVLPYCFLAGTCGPARVCPASVNKPIPEKNRSSAPWRTGMAAERHIAALAGAAAPSPADYLLRPEVGSDGKGAMHVFFRRNHLRRPSLLSPFEKRGVKVVFLSVRRLADRCPSA